MIASTILILTTVSYVSWYYFVVNKASLVVDYNALAEAAQALALFLPEAPTEMLEIFDEVQMHSPHLGQRIMYSLG